MAPGASASAKAASRPTWLASPGQKSSCANMGRRWMAYRYRPATSGQPALSPDRSMPCAFPTIARRSSAASKASTQTTRRNIIERFRKEHGRKPIARLERAHIKDIIGAKAETPEAANNLLKMLRVLLDYAVSIDMLASNPAIGVKRYKSRPDGIHTWSEAEIAQFEAAYPVGMKERLALALAIYTGQRVSDVARMGWQHVKDGWIALRQQKTSTPLMIKMH